MSQKKTIILIDDDKILIEMYEKKITENNFLVITASNGKEGFELILKNKPDLIVTDLVMPIFDGFDLLEKIQHSEAKNVPVIAFTNLNDPKDIQEAIQKGFKEYWIKANYTPSQIVKKIKEILK